MRRLLLVLAFSATLASARADVLVLSDGRRLTGEVVAEDDALVSFRADGVTRSYARRTITSLERTPREAGGEDGAKPPAADSPAAPARLSAKAAAWLGDLVARATDDDESVRRGAAAAILSLGPAALPVVRDAAAAADGPGKVALERLIAELETRSAKARSGGKDPVDGSSPEPGAAPRDAPGTGGARQVQQMLARLADELELRDEQRPRVEALLEALQKSQAEIHRAARREATPPETLEEKLAATRQRLLAAMKEVLDEPQYLLFEEMSARFFAAQRKGPKKGADAPGEPR